MLTLGHVSEALTGYQSGGGTQIITDVVIDPRLAIPGALFIALPGAGPEDGGGLAAAFEKGASVALAECEDAYGARRTFIVVKSINLATALYSHCFEQLLLR